MVKLKIRVVDITEEPKALEASDSYTHYPTLVGVQEAGECAFLSPLTVSLSVAREFDHIRVQGVVTSDVKLRCSRCLVEFDTGIESRFTIIYTKSAELQPEDEVELGEQDLISATYSGDEIEFDDEIAEQVLLEIPYKPLCSEECKGLCTVCGAERNNTECTCSESAVSMKFSSLKGLKLNR
jgi:uncharacterized protein